MIPFASIEIARPFEEMAHALFDEQARLPTRVIRDSRLSNYRLLDFDELYMSPLFDLLLEMARESSAAHVAVISDGFGVENYYRKHFGESGVILLESAMPTQHARALLDYPFDERSVEEVLTRAPRLYMFDESNTWALYAERYWEMGVLKFADSLISTVSNGEKETPELLWGIDDFVEAFKKSWSLERQENFCRDLKVGLSWSSE